MVAQTPIHSAKSTVWAAISERGIIGLFFFEEHGAQVAVTKERYVEVLEDFKKDLESLYPSLMTKFWFQQDGSKLSHLQYDFEWGPHSPDLSPPAFLSLGLSER